MNRSRIILLTAFSVFIISFAQQILTGQLVFTHDTIHWYGVFLNFVQSLARGSIPLWDPYSLNGAPIYFSNNMVGNLDPSVIVLAPLFRWFPVSGMHLYHWNFIFRLLFFWIGLYFFYREISRDKMVSALASSLVFLCYIPNAFWQHGSALIVVYGPWLAWSLLRCLDVSLPIQKRRFHWLLSAWFFGLSMNMYLFSYIIIFISIFFSIYIGALKNRRAVLRAALVSLDFKRFVQCLLIFACLSGPFLYSAFQLIPAQGDYFNFHRLTVPPGHPELITEMRLQVTNQEGSTQSTLHNLFGLFFSSADTRKFVDTTHRSVQINEHFLLFTPLGLFLLIFGVLTGYRKRLFWCFSIPFVYITLLMYLPAGHTLLKILRLMPTANLIRVNYNFLGYWYVCLGGLFLLAFSGLRDVGKSAVKRRLHVALMLTVALQVTVIVGYLAFLSKGWGLHTSSREFFHWTQQGFFSGGYYWLLSIVFLWQWARRFIDKPPIFISVILVALTCFSLMSSFAQLKAYVLQPGSGWHDGKMHLDLAYEYPEVRVPTLPQFADVMGYIGPIIRIPESTTLVSNPYGSFTRRAFDYLRFVPIENQKIASGIGSSRFGFFTSYFAVKGPEQAIRALQSLDPTELRQSVVVESETLINAVSAKQVSFGHRGQLLTLGLSRPWTDYYPVRRKLSDVRDSASKFFSKIGHYHILFFPDHAEFYRMFRYFPNPSLRFLSNGSPCYYRFHDWYLRAARTGLYPAHYSMGQSDCDVREVDGGLSASEEISGALVTNEVPALDGKMDNFENLSVIEMPVAESFSSPELERLKVVDFGPNHVSLVVTVKRAGLFYYADNYSQDWTAVVNSKPAHLYPSNFAFKAVTLPAGTHNVKFEFMPPYYRIVFGLFVLVSTVLPGLCILRFLSRGKQGSKITA